MMSVAGKIVLMSVLKEVVTGFAESTVRAETILHLFDARNRDIMDE